MKAKAPIQIQRDNLLVQVGELQKILAEKEVAIKSLQTELFANKQIVEETQISLTEKDATIRILQDELNLNKQVISEKNQLLLQIEEMQKSLTEKDSNIKSLLEQFQSLNKQFDDLQNDVVVVGEDFSHLLYEE
jgi:chromosome segregation ATPase